MTSTAPATPTTSGTSTTANVKVNITESPGTEYVVLLKTGNTAWGEVGRFTARSSDAAIRLYAAKSAEFIAKQETPVTLQAVPERSWKPITLRIETTQTLKLESA